MIYAYQDSRKRIVSRGAGQDAEPAYSSTWKQAEERAARMEETLSLINPPPDDNPSWFISPDSLTWRRAATHGGLQRFWMHAALGLFVGAIPPTAWWFVHMSLTTVALVGAALVTWCFLRYEETEGQRIRDHAYRDIGGYLNGLVVGGLGGVLVVGILSEWSQLWPPL